MSAVSELRAAVAFLTPFGQVGRGPTPAAPSSGTASPHSPSPATMAYFPLVGAGIGALVGLTWQQARKSFPPLLSAVVAVVADCALTGALHLDGLADTADGLLAHAPAKSRLDIMSEPAVGSFGAIALSGALLIRAAALAALEPSPALLAALYCSSRGVMVVAARSLPYARAEGLVSAFLPATKGPGPKAVDPVLLAALIGTGAALGLASAAAGRRGRAAIVCGWGAAGLVLGTARRRLGGYTGDVLGAAGVACEVWGLVAAAGARRG